MAKGITYFCTDKHGNIYNRYSERHTEAQYPFAVVSRGAGTTHAVGKGSINYSGRRDLAQANLNAATKDNGRPTWDKKDIIDVEAELLEVRAYPGRHAVEPAPQA